MTYADFFHFGKSPHLATGTKKVGYFDSLGAGGYVDRNYQYVEQGVQDKEAASEFDALMAGHDATSAAYVSQLKDLYDGYGQYAKDYGDKAQPIIDALTGDIKGLEKYQIGRAHV